jgi:hypothetical protein
MLTLIVRAVRDKNPATSPRRHACSGPQTRSSENLGPLRNNRHRGTVATLTLRYAATCFHSTRRRRVRSSEFADHLLQRWVTAEQQRKHSDDHADELSFRTFPNRRQQCLYGSLLVSVDRRFESHDQCECQPANRNNGNAVRVRNASR